MFYKIGFYFLSMFFFLLIVAILGTSIPCYFEKDWQFVGLGYIFSNIGTIVPLICSICFLYIAVFIIVLREKLKGTLMGPIKVKEMRSINSELMSFVASYFIPLVSFSVDEKWRHLIVLILLFAIIGWIYIKSDTYYLNPTLIVMGFKIYQIEGDIAGCGTVKVVVITREDLSKKCSLRYIPIDSNTYYGV